MIAYVFYVLVKRFNVIAYALFIARKIGRKKEKELIGLLNSYCIVFAVMFSSVSCSGQWGNTC